MPTDTPVSDSNKPVSPDHWIGFDLGGTKILSVAFDKNFDEVSRRRRKTKGHEGAKAGVERIIETIQQTLQEGALVPEQLAGIGIGCPGLVDLDKGHILDSANLGWKNVKLRDTLEDYFHCPVAVINDVDAGMYGEYRFGAAKGSRSALGVFPGTGIGGGFIYEGKILRGRTFSCLELGHVQVLPRGRLCGCGRVGCLETEASRLAIAAEAAKAAFRGEAPHLLKIAGTNVGEIRSGQLAEAIKAGDAALETIVRRAAGFLGTVIGDLTNVLLPDVVVLGGGLTEAMPDIILKEAEKAAVQRVAPPFVKLLKIVAAKLGDDAGVRGAAAWIAQQVAEKEKV
jgi:glucokinase